MDRQHTFLLQVMQQKDKLTYDNNCLIAKALEQQRAERADQARERAEQLTHAHEQSQQAAYERVEHTQQTALERAEQAQQAAHERAHHFTHLLKEHSAWSESRGGVQPVKAPQCNFLV